MELERNIEKARKLIDSMTGAQGSRLRDICRGIRTAQDRLNHKAAPFFENCMRRCKGMCCKNIHINEIINMLDLIYILSLMPQLYGSLIPIARKEQIFSADCLFLQNASGPCIFPHNVKPERCIITFCEDAAPIRNEIQSVRAKFSQLSRYTKFKRPWIWAGF